MPFRNAVERIQDAGSDDPQAVLILFAEQFQSFGEQGFRSADVIAQWFQSLGDRQANIFLIINNENAFFRHGRLQ